MNDALLALNGVSRESGVVKCVAMPLCHSGIAPSPVVKLATNPPTVPTPETLCDQVLLQLKLAKQARQHKVALKALNHLIAVLTGQYTQ